MKIIFLLAILSIVLITVFFQESYSQIITEPITVTVNQLSYEDGEIITISGTYRDLYSGTPISVIVKNPVEDVVLIKQIKITRDKIFSTNFIAGGELMSVGGTYTVTAFYGTQNRMANTSFEYGSSSHYIYPVNPNTITITTDKQYYTTNETIIITGNISNIYDPTVNITVYSPTHGIILTKQPIIQADKTFSTTLPATDNLFSNGTTYTITVQYQIDTQTITDTTSFEYGSSSNYSQLIPLTITTDSTTYQEDTPIYITGKLNNSHNGTTVTVSLQSPNGHLSSIHNIITKNNTYSTVIPTGNNTTILIPGLYTLTAHYGTETANTTFDYYINSTEIEEAYFIPDEQYLTLSDRDITKWNGELTKWKNSQNRTDNVTEFYYEKLDEAISNNQTNRIELYTERIGQSIALSSLYDNMIECLEEQLELLS